MACSPQVEGSRLYLVEVQRGNIHVQHRTLHHLRLTSTTVVLYECLKPWHHTSSKVTALQIWLEE